MKKIAKIVSVIAVVVAMVLGVLIARADAHYLPPQQWHRDYANCTHDAAYSTYGNGFAQMELVGSNCSGWSQVGVTTVDDYGVQRVAWCSLYSALFYPSDSCRRADHDGHTGMMAVAPGTAISMAVIACYDSSGGPVCARLDNGVFMPNNGSHSPPQF